MLAPQTGGESGIGEGRFDGVLAVVEVPVDPPDGHIGSAPGDHLQALGIRNSRGWIEDRDPHPGCVGETRQGGGTGIAGSGHQDQVFFRPVSPRRRLSPDRFGEEQRQDLQGHVLEGQGGAVPEFEDEAAVADLAHRSRGRIVEILAVGLGQKAGQALIGQIEPETTENGPGPFGIGQAGQGDDLVERETGQRLRNVESPPVGDAPDDHFTEGRPGGIEAASVAVVYRFTLHRPVHPLLLLRLLRW